MRTAERVLAAALTAITVAAIAGCVASARYPEEWAPLGARAPACSEVSGVFFNAGTSYRVKDVIGTSALPGTAYLASLFFTGEGRTLSSERAPTRLRLDATVPGRLTVVAIFADGREVPIALAEDRKEFACREGRIEVWSTGMEFIPIALMVGGTKTTHALSRASDGALIVESQAVGVGTALIWIPLGFSDRSWARFAAADEAPAAPASPD